MRRRRQRRPPSNQPVSLVSVYRLPKLAPQILYELLQERQPYVNISHRVMPSWKQHNKFIASHPYSAWYLIKSGPEFVGSVYLSAANEIGVFILARWRGLGFGPCAIRLLMRRHGHRRYLANINPRNRKSIYLFKRLGFRMIQQTFELRGQRPR
jgi:RimJ/RimL family protein N-acetyltransferase